MGLEHWDLRFNRRRILSIAAGTAGAMALTGSGHPAFAAAQPAGSTTPLPVTDMQKILGATGTVEDEVLRVEIDRSDLTATLPGNISASSQLVGELYFQPAHNKAAILNGDFCVSSDETNSFLDALISNGLVVQAFHQHLYDLTPVVWFVHFRGHMDPLKLAQAVRKAMDVTKVKLPQATPSKPTTPFDVKKLETIIGGRADIGSGGVVTVYVPRKENIFIDKAPIRPELGISAQIDFQPLDSKGTTALVVPDFALIGREVNPVFKAMRAEAFDIGCLYNQETDEVPQLYFSHMWKTGSPYDLAQSVRKGLMLTNSAVTS